MHNTHNAIKSLFFCILALSGTLHAQIGLDTASKPNIVFIMVDDARYDEFRNTGAPDWFVIPSIERIANEGANFTRTYAPTPICGPSRASIYTGRYTHEHGTYNNGDDITDSLPLIQQILHDQGYYTGFIGKYGNGFPAPIEFDYWLDIGDQELYKNIWVKFNSTNVFISGHMTDAFNYYIDRFFDSVQVHSDQPFAFFYFPLAPHTPNTPRSVDSELYTGEIGPFPDNFYEYPSLYPDFYKEGLSTWIKDSVATDKFIKDRLECLYGVDENVSHIFNYLDTNGQTDSTLMIFSSDNGYIMGEHMMRAKALPIEESIHVPLFVRYPAWFSEAIVYDNEMVELIDIPSTILDAVGLPDTFDFSGYSLKDLALPDTMRHYAFYEYEGAAPGANFDVPDIRGVRGFDKAYFYSSCDCFTEEFYDFTLDPDQNQNQILNPDYYAQVLQYRAILDSMRLAKNDTSIYQINACKLVGAYEVPDSLDNDCDGVIDDSLIAFIRYFDFDGDGYGSPDSSIIVFGEITGYVNNNTDCNDSVYGINPGAPEICDGLDNDCDGLIDDEDADATGQPAWFADVDMDGYGDAATATLSCLAPEGYVAISGDCNDTLDYISTGSPEVCNLLDDDCDGLIDDDDPDVSGQITFYTDIDEDGYGDLFNTILSCFLPVIGYTTDTLDCDDTHNTVYPFAIEICDGLDNNCNGLTDDADSLIVGMSNWYLDFDVDEYGNPDSNVVSCFAPSGFRLDNTDCNDSSAAVHPDLLDICDDLDNDCDGLFDEDTIIPIIVPESPLEFCTGGEVNLIASPFHEAFVVQWYKNGIPISDANNFNYVVATQGNYSVSYTGPIGCYTISTITPVTVYKNPKPTITNLTGFWDLCFANPIKLKTTYKAGYTYQWYKGPDELAGATTYKYDVVTSGNYKIEATDAHGCMGTSKAYKIFDNCELENPDLEKEGTNIYVFPNPSDGLFTITMTDLPESGSVLQVRVLNVLGEVVYAEDAACNDVFFAKQLALNSPVGGVYLVEVVIDGRKWYTQLVMH